MKKQKAEIFWTEEGWKIKTGATVWAGTFETEEEATTYALRDGCSVEGC